MSSYYVDILSHGVPPLEGVKQGMGENGKNKLFSGYHSPDGVDGCCITSNKSLTCLQLVFMSNLSNFRHAFASRRFVSVSVLYFLVIFAVHNN